MGGANAPVSAPTISWLFKWEVWPDAFPCAAAPNTDVQTTNGLLGFIFSLSTFNLAFQREFVWFAWFNMLMDINQHKLIILLCINSCIPVWWKCDGQRDCRDGSDEPSTCPTRHCRLGQFQCNDGNCTSSHFLCNSNRDCPDGSDEDAVLCGGFIHLQCPSGLHVIIPNVFLMFSMFESVNQITRLCFQLRTNAKAISGSVRISGASLSRGSAMARTTVVISLTKTLPTAPLGLVALDSSGAATGAASRRAGNVTLIMIVVTIQMNH